VNPGASPARCSSGDELASCLIHGLGILPSIGGLVLLLMSAARHGDARAMVGSAVYGFTLVLLYTASTLHRSVPMVAARPALGTLDHIAIFLLVAGTYTPFTLIALPGAWGWSMFAAVWTLALAGSAPEPGLLKRYRHFAVLLYVGMGWIGMIAFRPLSALLQAGGMQLLTGSVLHLLAVLLYVISAA
jgi:hemolysin III